MAVVSRVTSKLSAPIKRARKKLISKVKEEEKPKRHIYHGMIMRYPPLALQKMKKQTSV